MKAVLKQSRTSIIWKMKKEDIQNIINNSNSLKDVLNKLGLVSDTGGNYKTLKERIKEDFLDISILNSNRIRDPLTFKKKDIYSYLKNNTSIFSGIKKRLIRENIIENKCYECGLVDNWNNKPITLQLDHIDGNKYNNCIENLRLLCPNCHSQTHTFAGRNMKYKLEEKFCTLCFNKISKTSKSNICKSCADMKQRKVERPSKEILQEEIKSIPYIKIAEKYGVTDSTIRKWCKRYNINK